ncbi:hypothetical protein PIROE2DRAFT_61279 [Piromyces sp. E2]|nr:hypothetical protein PIROE2DRAFT_61279 [Piromyces sp. E2]|eukprot:OUM63464.1 hypothetical protein PIROE2DRAFT_61279 [Piromyces sp. E2]
MKLFSIYSVLGVTVVAEVLTTTTVTTTDTITTDTITTDTTITTDSTTTTSPEQELNLTNDCITEISRYEECFDGLDIDELKSPEQIENFCLAFTQPKCQNFMNDLSKTTYACMVEGGEGEEEGKGGVIIYDDVVALKKVLEFKIEYLLVCSQKKDGSLCPVSQLYTTNHTALMEQEQEKMTEEQIKVVTDDCQIEECNERMLTTFSDFNRLLQVLSIVYHEYYENDNEPYFLDQLLFGYQDFYANKKCDVKDILPDPHEEVNTKCMETLAQYQDCVTLIRTKNIGKDQIEDFCDLFQQPQCESLVKAMETEGEEGEEFVCMPTSSMLTKTMEETETILAYKMDYLLFCSKDQTGNRCPVSHYSVTHLNDLFTEQESITASQHDIITQDCQLEECNKKRMAYFNASEQYSIINYYLYDYLEDPKAEPYFLSQLTYGYQDFYYNKTCDVTDIRIAGTEKDPEEEEEEEEYGDEFTFGTDSNLSPQCQKEYTEYSTCLFQLMDIDTDSSKGIKNMCQIMSGAQCHGIVQTISNPSSVCIESIDTKNPNFMDYFYGISILSFKMEYLMYCVTDSQGKVCPLSQYLIDTMINEENNNETGSGGGDGGNGGDGTEEDIIPPEQLHIIADDCRNINCNSRMRIINKYANYIENAMKSIQDGEMMESDEGAMEKFINNYLEGSCSAIDQSNASLDSKVIAYLTEHANEEPVLDTNPPVSDPSSGTLGPLGNPTEACLAEVQKYNECLGSLGISSSSSSSSTSSFSNTESAEDLKKFCTAVEGNACKAFLSDINNSQSACINVENPVIADMISGGLHQPLRAQYQLFCSKDTTGKVCPLSQFLLENLGKYDTITDLTSQQLEMITTDCKDGSCNARMVAFLNYSESMPILASKLTETMGESVGAMLETSLSSILDENLTTLVNKVSSYYKNKECGAADNTINDDNKLSSDASSRVVMTLTFIIMTILSSFLLL